MAACRCWSLRFSRWDLRIRFFACIIAVRWSQPPSDAHEVRDLAFCASAMKVSWETSPAIESSRQVLLAVECTSPA
nr:hypothetical protein [Luteolibacter yonseiensis]